MGRERTRPLRQYYQRKVEFATREELNEMLEFEPMHDERAHEGMRFSQTGYVRGCFRCRVMKRIEILEQKNKEGA